MKFQVPTHCPLCATELILSSTETDIICPNSTTCPAQLLGRLTYFCNRGNMDIKGLSGESLKKFLELGIVEEVYDIFELAHNTEIQNKIMKMEGFGSKSMQNLKESINARKEILDSKFLASLGIDGIGKEAAKLICKIIEPKY